MTFTVQAKVTDFNFKRIYSILYSCAALKTQSAIEVLKCASPFLSDSLSDDEKLKLLTWFIQKKNVPVTHECNSEESQSLPNHLNSKLICFSEKGQLGVFAFQRDGQNFRLLNIKSKQYF